MQAQLSDAELVHRLQLVAKHGSAEKAATHAGVRPSAFKTSIRHAKAKGLTATTKLKRTEDVLRTKVKTLELELAAVHRENVTAETIRSTIYNLADVTADPPRWLSKATAPRAPGVPVAFWSDWHWGEVVRSEEVGGVNAFNRTIAKKRLRRLVDTTVDLAKRHMVSPKYPGIVICLGGDMISGNIHDELRETNEGHLQQTMLELQEHLESAISHMADEFGKVFLPCVVGNHGRMTHKPRMKGRVFESFEWNLYCQLERHFRNDKRITFSIPSETDAHFDVCGHRFCLTHGDALGVKGGDGIIGAIGPIARGAIKIGRSEAQIGRNFDTLLMGHWHTYIPRGDASPVLVNGSLKGYDEYARIGLRVPYSRPSQALFFVHPDHGVTAQWQVYLDDKRTSAGSAKWLSWEQRI